MDTFASNFDFLSCYGKPYPTTQKTGTTNIWVGKQNRKTKEITEIQQIILALHIVKKERRKLNRQVNIVKQPKRS